MRLSLEQVLQATGGRSAGDVTRTFTSYHTDSREVVAGGLFFALRGAEMDGHRFAADAVARGAAGVVVSEPLDMPSLIRVADTWKALYDLARAVADRVGPLVVAVTGSNGKTSTKEMLAAVLGARHRVLKTEGNLNTETGVPLTLLRLETEHTAAVLEMGMQGPGQIARLAALARPLVGVITGVGSVHAEYFTDGRAGIAKAKGELLQALPVAGLAVLNAEDDFYELLRSLSPAPVVGYGLAAGEFRSEACRPLPEGGSELIVDGVAIRIGPSGRHQARNALAALAVGRFAGVSLAEGGGRLADIAIEHRLQELRGVGGCVLVDDAYNASPESMLAAFETVSERPRRGRLLALLGEMRELGPLAGAAHEEIGRRAATTFDRVAVVDVGYGRVLAEAAGADLVADNSEAAAWVRASAGDGDVVLVKGSNGVRLFEVVRELTRPPE